MCRAQGGMAIQVFGQCHMGHSDMQNLNEQQANLIRQWMDSFKIQTQSTSEHLCFIPEKWQHYIIYVIFNLIKKNKPFLIIGPRVIWI